MFKKSERLSRVQFSEYFKIGRRFHSANFTLVFVSAPLLLVSVVVGKKVHKLAVDRNSLRRRVYASIRLNLAHEQKGVFIVIAKPTAKQINRKNIPLEILDLLALSVKSR